MYTIKNLDDKYYKNYKYLLNNSSIKFNLVNKNLLFNFTFNDENIVCNYSLK